MNKVTHIILNILSILIAICGGLMALDATIHQIGLFSPEVALYWPIVLAAATIIARISTILVNYFNTNPVKLICLAFLVLFSTSCVGAGKKLRYFGKEVAASTDFSAGVSYDGVTVSDTISGGRNKVNIGVDGKQVVKAIRR